MAAASFLFALVGVEVKYSSATLPTEMVVFFRNFMGLVALVPWLFLLGWRGLQTDRPGRHFGRAMWGLLAMYCSFYSIGRMRLADALLLNYTAPLFIPFVARAWLKEPIPDGMSRVLGLGFLGVLLVLKPGTGLFQPVSIVALLTGVFAAVAQVSIRQLTRDEPTVRIVFYFAVFASLVSAAPLPAVWRNPSPATWGVLVLMGVTATAAQLCLTQSYGSAPAARVGPFIYTMVIFAGALDWLFWRVLPDGWSLAGAVFIVAAGVLAIRRLPSAPSPDVAAPKV
jgi:drug/metabolite transporter (DMT)-like permease